MRPEIITIEARRHPEFDVVREDLSRWAEVHAVSSVAAALDLVDSRNISPTLFLLFQAFPGQWRELDVQGLRRLAPLAHFVLVLGSWCEGESRSGHPVAGAARIYWHQWIPLGSNELQRLASGRLSAWTLPATSEIEDRVLQRASPGPPTSGGDVWLAADDPDIESLLADALERAGYRPDARKQLISLERLTVDESGAPLAVILDCRDIDAMLLRRVVGIRDCLPETPILCLVGFPRVAERRALLTAGATHVVSKPFCLDALLDSLPRKRAT